MKILLLHTGQSDKDQLEGWLSAPGFATKIINESQTSVSHDCRLSATTNITGAG